MEVAAAAVAFLYFPYEHTRTDSSGERERKERRIFCTLSRFGCYTKSGRWWRWWWSLRLTLSQILINTILLVLRPGSFLPSCVKARGRIYGWITGEKKRAVPYKQARFSGSVFSVFSVTESHTFRGTGVGVDLSLFTRLRRPLRRQPPPPPPLFTSCSTTSSSSSFFSSLTQTQAATLFQWAAAAS